MLYYLPYTEHEVEKLFELLAYFFDKVENENHTVFNKQLLFPDWYFDTPNCLEKLEAKLKYFVEDVYRVLQLEIISAFKKSNQIEYLFNNKLDEDGNELHIFTSLDFPTQKDFLNKLFADLYSDQLSPKESTFNKKISDLNLYDHYKKLELLTISVKGNFLVCPFCGIENLKMIDTEGRPDYDHLLPKGSSLFIFSSVNLKNLFPIGVTCNKLKDTHHLLYSDETRSHRSIAFYPYADLVDPFNLCDFRLTCIEHPRFRYGGKWEVSIIPRVLPNIDLEEKISSWDRVFNIQHRYEDYITHISYDLVENMLDNLGLSLTEQSIRDKIDQKIREDYKMNYPLISTQFGIIPLRIFFQWALSDLTYLPKLVSAKLSPISQNDVVINNVDFEF